MDRAMVKKDAKDLIIKEQILFNDASGLTIEFVVVDDANSPYRIRLYGDSLAMGNREITLGKDGVINGGGTYMGPRPFPFD